MKYNENDPHQPSIFDNWISVLGLYLSTGALFAVISLFGMDLFHGFSNPYMGILTYIVAPTFLIAGIVLVIIGAWRERRKRHGGPPPKFRLDLNLERHRTYVFTTIVLAFVFFILTTVGAYQSYHFSESVTFCGQTCHTVMKPEFTAYQNSPHARVACTQCHIGSGAGWFVRSKLSGAYQVYAVFRNNYPRPIPTPVRNLRPAQDTCEQCHWPKKFFGSIERENDHFKHDKDNTPWRIRMLVKIGGGDPANGLVGGIHWHMNISNRVEYIATDKARQVIPWVRITDSKGNVRIYQSQDEPLKPEQVQTGEMRRMDCIDCHNRPSHVYMDPDRAIDVAMITGRIDRTIPSIKLNAVKALAAEYKTGDQAKQGIQSALRKEYQSYSDQDKVQKAILEVQSIYSKNFFPEMKVNWKTYPNNIGHMIFPGCFRCHDGKHATTDGKVLNKDCNSCHTIIAQGPPTEQKTLASEGMPFQHPEDIGDTWQEMNCNECHSGGPMQ